MKEPKKILSFLRSMRFGVILLVLIVLFSIVGTVVPQGKDPSWYVQTYPLLHGWILLLKVYDLYNSWYYQLLLALLVLNLTLCSLLRVRSVVRSASREKENLLRGRQNYSFGPEHQVEIRERIRANLKAMHCREEQADNAFLYRKYGIGRYGSFLTHLSILLIIVSGALVLYLPKSQVLGCLPGESLSMEDGTKISVSSFSRTDEQGRIDYTCQAAVELPDGTESGTREIKVNHPLKFGQWKLYMETYGLAACIRAKNMATGEEDSFTLDHRVFLSVDGKDGVWFEHVFQAPSISATQYLTPDATSDTVYYIQTAKGGELFPRDVYAGEEVTVGDITYTFEEAIAYPGLRIKHTPPFIQTLLGISFVLLIAGLYLTFFMQPVLVRLDKNGGYIGGPKPEGMVLAMQQWLSTTPNSDGDAEV